MQTNRPRGNRKGGNAQLRVNRSAEINRTRSHTCRKKDLGLPATTGNSLTPSRNGPYLPIAHGFMTGEQ